MARVIQLTVTCDPCMAAGTHTMEGVVTSPPIEGRTVDLCPEHVEQYLTPLSDLLVLYGELAELPARRRSPRKPEATGGAAAHPPPGIQCPLCPSLSGTVKSLSVHLVKHGTNMAALYGTACPLCGHLSASSSALSSHLRRSHDILGGSPAAFARAVIEGDPHLVVSQQAKAVRKLAARVAKDTAPARTG